MLFFFLLLFNSFVLANCKTEIKGLFKLVNNNIVQNFKLDASKIRYAVFPEQNTKIFLKDGKFIPSKIVDYIKLPEFKDYKLSIEFLKTENSKLIVRVTDEVTSYNIYIDDLIDSSKKIKIIEYLGVGLKAIAFNFEYYNAPSETLKIYYDDIQNVIGTRVDFIGHEVLDRFFSSGSGAVAFSAYKILDKRVKINTNFLSTGRVVDHNAVVVKLTPLDKSNNFRDLFDYLIPAQQEIILNQVSKFFKTSNKFFKKIITKKLLNADGTKIHLELSEIGIKEFSNIKDFFKHIIFLGSVITRNNIRNASFDIFLYNDGTSLNQELPIYIVLKLTSEDRGRFKLKFLINGYNIQILNDRKTTKRPYIYFINTTHGRVN